MSIIFLAGSPTKAYADPLPAVDVSGEISSNTEWTAGNVYVVEGEVEVLSGVTLTIDPGAIIKYETDLGYAPIEVNSGGTLNATGTADNPVIFTSYADDSAGGDTNGDGSDTSPAPGDYEAAIYSESDGTVDVSYATIEYATYGAIVYEGYPEFLDTAFSDDSYGISAPGTADVTVRGSFNGIVSQAIMACNWGESCVVDAAYTNWGSADGPFVSGDPADNMVCGNVTVSPWVYGGDDYTDSTNPFSVQNCDGSYGPDVSLEDSISDFQSGINDEQIQCDDGFEDACAAITTAYECLQGAVDSAYSYYGLFPLPGASDSSDVSTFAGDTLSATSTYINGIESGTIVGDGSEFAGDLFNVVEVMSSLQTAYNDCNPE
jgi:hypothetical protein